MLPCMKTSELRKQHHPGANLTLILSTALIIASAFVCRGAEASGYQPILQPSIFWHDNQWETYENGQWVPYRGSANNTLVESEPEMIPEEPQTPDMVDTNIYVPPYGWGFIEAPAFNHAHRRHVRPHVRTELRRPHTGIGQPKAGIAQPNLGIGQPTTGIGNPNGGTGQP